MPTSVEVEELIVVFLVLISVYSGANRILFCLKVILSFVSLCSFSHYLIGCSMGSIVYQCWPPQEVKLNLLLSQGIQHKTYITACMFHYIIDLPLLCCWC